MAAANDHHIYFTRRMNEKRSEQRRQQNLPIQGEDQRQGHERRSAPETQPPAVQQTSHQQTSHQQQQQWRSQYSEKNPFTELLSDCCRTVHSEGLRLDVIVRIHPKKP
jgi:hypothetical protein